jgi:hypothetical protein
MGSGVPPSGQPHLLSWYFCTLVSQTVHDGPPVDLAVPLLGVVPIKPKSPFLHVETATLTGKGHDTGSGLPAR